MGKQPFEPRKYGANLKACESAEPANIRIVAFVKRSYDKTTVSRCNKSNNNLFFNVVSKASTAASHNV